VTAGEQAVRRPDGEVAELDRIAADDVLHGAAVDPPDERAAFQRISPVPCGEDLADLACLGDRLGRHVRLGRGNADQAFEVGVSRHEARDRVDLGLVAGAGEVEDPVQLHVRVGLGDVALDVLLPHAGDGVLMLLLENRVLARLVDL
jgi:hypothetical protein